MAAAGYPKLTISFLRSDTPDRYCTEYPDSQWRLFTAPASGVHPPGGRRHGKYENGASILVLPEIFEAYWESAGQYTRRKVRKALKEGYAFSVIDRDEHLDEIHAINTSLKERQGRPMDELYMKRPGPYGPLPNYTCPRHRIVTYGVLHGDVLVAYTVAYQVGEMCVFSTILGHGEHLNSGIMFLLVSETVRDLMNKAGLRFPMYNMHRGGTDGLRFFKEQMGFKPYLVKWVMGDTKDPVRKLTRRGRLLVSSAGWTGRRVAHPVKQLVTHR